MRFGIGALAWLAPIPWLHALRVQPGLRGDAALQLPQLSSRRGARVHRAREDFIAHRVLLGAQIPGFENVTNLDRLPEWGASVIALPAKIGKGSGAPLRIVALLPKEE